MFVIIIVALSICSEAKFPVRVKAITTDTHHSPSENCVPQLIGSFKKNISEIIDNLFPPQSANYTRNCSLLNCSQLINSTTNETCNCSQLIDSARNVSCITPCCGEGRLIFDADLTSGNSFIAAGSGLTWTRPLYDPSSSQSCDQQGVLRINFPLACNNSQSCKLRFDFSFLSDHTGINFNIGDSSNNGYGGDNGHSSNSAEVHNVNQRFYVYSNNLPGYASNTLDGHLQVDNVPSVVHEHFTVTIGDEFVMFDNNNGVQRSYRSRYLFTLNGQPTTYGSVDYLISLSMNRVISTSSRSGTGLCRASIRALNC